MKHAVLAVAVCVLVLTAAQCRPQERGAEPDVSAEDTPEILAQPDRVLVQHLLIAFEGTIPDKTIARTREEAEKLALELLDRAKAGEDFDALVREYTDDQHPGIYAMANFDIEPDPSAEEYSRSRMVKSFGDVSFGLPVGGFGLAVYDPDASKYGWHIIKRLE
jgi:parvulin-like peptidyl-prolyl isomerase